VTKSVIFIRESVVSKVLEKEARAGLKVVYGTFISTYNLMANMDYRFVFELRNVLQINLF